MDVESETKGAMTYIPAGAFQMGSDRHYPEEAPAHKVRVNGFWIDRYAVTNYDFNRFVQQTGYVTVAERPANPHDYPRSSAGAVGAFVGHVQAYSGTC